ncbi:APOA1BP family protein [Megaselia abdita]
MFAFASKIAKKLTTTYLVQGKRMSSIKLLNQSEAVNIDVELFNDYKFSVDQLMELAGFSCAQAIQKVYSNKKLKILVVCGPGNNGGDGLVCARHLKTMNFNVELFYPKRTSNDLYERLAHQCSEFGLRFLEAIPHQGHHDLIVDALFGFSFKPPVREQFVPLMDFLLKTNAPIASIDIPSGWNVNNGPSEECFHPDLLISLTAPKLCSKFFKGKYHYLGGRFVPDKLQEKYELNLPQYKDSDSCVQLL